MRLVSGDPREIPIGAKLGSDSLAQLTGQPVFCLDVCGGFLSRDATMYETHLKHLPPSFVSYLVRIGILD